MKLFCVFLTSQLQRACVLPERISFASASFVCGQRVSLTAATGMASSGALIACFVAQDEAPIFVRLISHAIECLPLRPSTTYVAFLCASEGDVSDMPCNAVTITTEPLAASHALVAELIDQDVRANVRFVRAMALPWIGVFRVRGTSSVYCEDAFAWLDCTETGVQCSVTLPLSHCPVDEPLELRLHDGVTVLLRSAVFCKRASRA